MLTLSALVLALSGCAAEMAYREGRSLVEKDQVGQGVVGAGKPGREVGDGLVAVAGGAEVDVETGPAEGAAHEEHVVVLVFHIQESGNAGRSGVGRCHAGRAPKRGGAAFRVFCLGFGRGRTPLRERWGRVFKSVDPARGAAGRG